MTDGIPIETKNLDRYGYAELPWSRARDRLAASATGPERTWFLGTARPDGTLHAAGVGALWHDEELYFTSGPGTRKSRNLAANAACTLSTKLDGLDIVFEGHAARVTDAHTLETIAARYRQDGWPAEVDGDAFTAPYSAPSAGPAPWYLYRFTFHTVFGVATAEPYGATRWRFDGG
jgi:hypothetical protein